MPRKAPEQVKPWRALGVTLGFIRNGTFYIYRVVHGRRYRISTGCHTAEAALLEYRRFEADPAHYIPRRSAGTGFAAAVIDYLRYSELTLQNSEGHVSKQEGYFANLGCFKVGGHCPFSSLDTFTASDIRAYMAWRADGGVGGRKVGRAAVNRDLAALKGLMAWARAERRTNNTADTEVPLLREDLGADEPKEVPEAVWRSVLEKLLPRWRLASQVLLGAGLRYGELARLRQADVLPHAIHVPKAKSRRARVVPVTPRTRLAALRLIAMGGVPDDEAGQMDHRLEVACRAAGVDKFTAHRFRHTYAVVSLRNGVDLRELQARLGHSSIRTTEKYLRALRSADGRGSAIGAPF